MIPPGHRAQVRGLAGSRAAGPAGPLPCLFITSQSDEQKFPRVFIFARGHRFVCRRLSHAGTRTPFHPDL
jgi:hypothetical protein